MAPMLPQERRGRYLDRRTHPRVADLLAAQLQALHRRGSAMGWPPELYGAWADLLSHHGKGQQLVGTLRYWAETGR